MPECVRFQLTSGAILSLASAVVISFPTDQPIDDLRTVLRRSAPPMPITIYGTDWCDDTRRTRAFLAARGARAKFIDIEARPEAMRELSVDNEPITIPIVIFDDGVRLEDPSQDQLEQAFSSNRTSVSVRHRTTLNQELRRFEQFRNDQLVASADFVERSRTIVIVGFRHHEPSDASLEEETVKRLTAGLVEIVTSSGRDVDIDIDASLGTEPESGSTIIAAPTIAAELTSQHVAVGPAAPLAPIDHSTAARQPDPTVAGCPLTQRFTDLWSGGADHKDATRLAQSEGIGRLAVIKGLHTLWEMPLTPEAIALAFGESGIEHKAAMFHVLGWIIDQNPASTMSEFQAFDDATGISVKAQALSAAERPRDTIAMVDRMGPGLHLRTIDEAHAREMAATTIGEADGLLRIQDQSTLRLSFGWIFLYQSAEYMESGDYSTMISGNAPLLVDRFTGALWITGTEERPNSYAENYAATGDPLTSGVATS